MNNYKSLSVFMDDKKVGTLATTMNHLIAFEYDKKWLENGFSISPFSLPLEKGVFLPKRYETFEGLFGVFSDSLPDGWGRLLVDRLLLKEKMNPIEVDSLNRLAIVASTGMGALSYYPESNLAPENVTLSLDEIALECEKMFETNECDNLDELFSRGGSSGGARPKIFYKIEGEEWIVKFPSSIDSEGIGEQEYNYSLCARKCGIDIPKTQLFPSKNCSGYFATKRFDRNGKTKVHMLSASALLETSHRIPNLDYNILMQLTMHLTNDYREIEKLYRLMCFNVFAHNRDDHSKNFSYLYNIEKKKWMLSPAYDLTFSSSIGGEHATTINGNGRNPDLPDILEVAENIKLDKKQAKRIAEEIREIVYTELGNYLESVI